MGNCCSSSNSNQIHQFKEQEQPTSSSPTTATKPNNSNNNIIFTNPYDQTNNPHRHAPPLPPTSHTATAAISKPPQPPHSASSKEPTAASAYVARHGEITREQTVGNFHRGVLHDSSPTTFHRMVSSFRVFIATWNVGDAEPASMAALFAHINDHGRGADIIFVAAQECNYKPTDVTHQSARDHWNASIDAIFPDYSVVCHRGLWEMRTMLLVKNSIKDEVKDVVTSREATGIASIAGNKGGIGIGCTVYETRLLFVGSHLAAHLEEVDKRNRDFYEILEGIEGDFNFQGIQPLNYFHHVFWCGDLNYRINDLTREEVLKAIEDHDIQKLLSHDQLIAEMKKGNVFNHGFTEAATPSFYPTYRFLRNTDPSKPRVYDDFKGRIPSWCDRILHKPLGGPTDVAHTVVYDAEHAVRSSDHSPVFALFDVNSRRKARESLEAREAAWTEYNNNINNNATKPSRIGTTRHILSITDVRAKDLLDADVGGESNVSDPYVVFKIVGISNPENANSIARTKTIQDNLNPNWKDELFRIELGERIDVGMQYLHCVVVDEDVVKDDALGQAVISLDRVWEQRGKSSLCYDDVPVMLNGKQYGSISLTMMIMKQQ